MASSGELQMTYQSWTLAEAGSDEERRLMDMLLLLCAVQIRRVVSKVSASANADNARSDREDHRAATAEQVRIAIAFPPLRNR